MSHPQSTDVLPPPHQVFFSVHTSGVFLFRHWHVNSTQDLAIVLVVICILAVIYEIIQGTMNLEEFSQTITRKSTCGTILRLTQRSILHIGRMMLGYILMMSAMTYNIWMLMTIVLSAGLGFLISRPILNALYSKPLSLKRDKPLHRKTKSSTSTSQKNNSDRCDAKHMPPYTNNGDCYKDINLSDNQKNIALNEPLLKHVTNGKHIQRETVL